MKVVILAGGYGTRISEETQNKPKPLVEIGNNPILWHILKHYSFYGFNDFIISGGYRIQQLKEYFINFDIFNNDIEVNLETKKTKILKNNQLKWNIKIINTGLHTNTAGRILGVKKYLNKDENFLMTYGDGLSNINLNKLINLHQKNNPLVTLSAVNLKGRFGSLEINKNIVQSFIEKPRVHKSFINGGFFVISNKIFKFSKNNNQSFENDILPKISRMKKLQAYKHNGFWQAMDTIRDKEMLELEWNKNNCPWRIWSD